MMEHENSLNRFSKDEVNPSQFAVLIYKVELLTAQMAATNVSLDKNVEKLTTWFTGYLEANNQRHDESTERAVLHKAELLARVVALETDKRSFADKISGGFWTIKAAGILAFFVIIYLVKGLWDGIMWMGGRFFGN